jgi:hypothetical protein
MHTRFVCVSFLAFASLSVAVAADPKDRRPEVVEQPDAKNAARVKWAKGVLADFLDSAFAGDLITASALFSPEFVQGAKEDGPNGLSNFLAKRLWGSFNTFKVISEEMDPDGGEVVLKGELLGKSRNADFKARVAREGVGGKWSIRYFVVKERKEPDKPKAKEGP